MKTNGIYILLILSLFIASCDGGSSKSELPPWGSEADDSATLSLSDIVSNGEIIAATLSGPDTYYEYRGERLGLQYLLCEKFAAELGVTLRVQLCRDSADLRRMLLGGDADMVITPILDDADGELRLCGVTTDDGRRRWAVASQCTELADAIDRWYSEIGKELQAKGDIALRNTDRLSSPFGMWGGESRRSEGVSEGRAVRNGRDIGLPSFATINIPPTPPGAISPWDNLFKKYASVARCDWELLAAQCRQESGFDPMARSWAGACGLMQLMPQTAASLGVPYHRIFDPETNIRAAAKLMSSLSSLYSGISPFEERLCFMLAAYNCGSGHVSDAQTLARKNGKNGERWGDVERYMLLLSLPEYYNDPDVRHGYVRSSETVDYVRSIRQRYSQYTGGRVPAQGVSSDRHSKATKRHRFRQS
ncbi:MAG: transglycosylase SLT domain-containing protein [Prevotella sp.]|uniref:transglycosylase SLT domain-containing protein n=1 Tax=Prevotella sp. TaxID=59823 RepID=UPI002A26AF0B|nr:transglycosylase SLT domain-containing protein [Prevotella sp.]MDD7318169.1 transglycosylase SLT domain-containing protein [Prevotellaceae bacterium]MDY4020942.1 transglycosylase SLT domain-containing protein [Prevotella sp.]